MSDDDCFKAQSPAAKQELSTWITTNGDEDFYDSSTPDPAKNSTGMFNQFLTIL